MKKKKINVNKIKVPFLLIVLIFFLFTVFIARVAYLCVVDYKVGDSTISAFIKNRNTKEEIIMPTRGTIYDNRGNVLAEDVASYTIIAYLNPSRSENSKTPLHVVDKEMTAKVLAPLLEMEESEILRLLNKDVYQTEFGVNGRNLSQIEMETIDNLKLPGIDFIKSTKRYYPNGDFASYAVGYTVNFEDDDGAIWKKGELGIEKYYDTSLSGNAGFVTYEKDRYGYKIANGREYVEDAVNGDNIYLTIDNSVQLFTENAVAKLADDSKGEWAFMIVADAKSGAILSYATSPSFDPNVRNLTSYIDPLTGYIYEPGSTMKIFSYMCAIENGNYNGNTTFESGTITYKDSSDGTETVIHDWNKTGWGTLTLDQGFALSSNVGASTLLENNIITKRQLSNCYKSYGFGKTVGFTSVGEASGSIKFSYDIEAATASFGQGITVTPVQMIQALTAVSNDGEMLKPYIVSKIVDPNNNKVTYEGTREVVDRVISSETSNKIKELMASVISENKEVATGYAYYMEDYPMLGKTGTAQIFDAKTNSYMSGESDYIYSFAGMYPSDDPKLIIYAGLKRPQDTYNYLADAVKSVVVNTSKYLNIDNSATEYSSYKLDYYVNQESSSVSTNLKSSGLKTLVLGTGSKIINQYPSKGTIMYPNSIVVLLTDKYDKEMPDLVGLSYKDAMNILKLMGVKYSLKGNGYVTSQNISVGEKVLDDVTVELQLNTKTS